MLMKLTANSKKEQIKEIIAGMLTENVIEQLIELCLNNENGFALLNIKKLKKNYYDIDIYSLPYGTL